MCVCVQCEFFVCFLFFRVSLFGLFAHCIFEIPLFSPIVACYFYQHHHRHDAYCLAAVAVAAASESEEKKSREKKHTLPNSWMDG